MSKILLVCLICLAGIPAHAIYTCQPQLPLSLPDIVGKDYPTARSSLIDDGWQPAAIASGRFPETQSCARRGGLECDFLFNNASVGYTLVVEAEGNPDVGGLYVTRHFFRCKY